MIFVSYPRSSVALLLPIILSLGCDGQVPPTEKMESSVVSQSLSFQDSQQSGVSPSPLPADVELGNASPNADYQTRLLARQGNFVQQNGGGSQITPQRASLEFEKERREAFDQGRKVGEAQAAAKHFERGLAMGKEQGRREGHEEAADENRLATELAVKEAVAIVEKITRLESAEDFRQSERLREMTDSSLPVYFLGTVLVSLLFFLLARMDRWRTRNADAHAAEYRTFIYQIFDVVKNLDRRNDGDGGGSTLLPPPFLDDNRFQLGGDR